MKVKIRLRPRTICFAMGALIGFVVFYYLFGLSTVNPTNIAWIQNINGDLIQHYMGWVYYRDAPWHFPNIGKIDTLAYPNGISLVYMDVVPLFAIVFKVFSSILPATFQYLGIFTLLSFMLQGGFAALIISRFTNRTVLSIFGAIIIVCTPLIISRSFAHTALSAHWLVLAAIYFAIRFYQEKSSVRPQIITWSVLMPLAVLTHAYFIPIVGFIFLFSLVLQFKSLRSSILLVAIPALTAFIAFASIGGLSRGMETNGGSGLGLYSLNVLSPVVPLGYSAFFNTTFTQPNWEGLAYFGLGVLLFLPVTWFIFLYKYRRSSVKILSLKIFEKLKSTRILILSGMTVLLLAVALSPLVYLGDSQLFTVPTPGIVERLWEIFRSTGRLFWPIYYATIIGALALFVTYTRKWNYGIVVALLLPFVILQSVDILGSSNARGKGETVRHAAATPKKLDSLNAYFIDNFCDKKQVILVDNSLTSGVRMFQDLSDYIVTCQPILTSGYFARFPKTAILTHAENNRTALIDGTLAISPDNLYISQSEHFVVSEIDQGKYSYKQYGNYWVLGGK